MRGDTRGRPMGRSSFLRLPTRSSSQRSRSGQRLSGKVTGAAGEFQHRTGHPLCSRGQTARSPSTWCQDAHEQNRSHLRQSRPAYSQLVQGTGPATEPTPSTPPPVSPSSRYASTPGFPKSDYRHERIVISCVQCCTDSSRTDPMASGLSRRGRSQNRVSLRGAR